MIIGNVHSRFYKSQTSLDRTELNDGDVVVVIGDMINHGPDLPLWWIFKLLPT